MHNIEELREQVIKAVDHAAHQCMMAPSELYDPIVYTLSMGGKRLRPILTLLACDLYNGDLNEAIHPAIGLEIFHNFTLLHDDIMDMAPIRRGKPTVYKKWNTNIAILSGDTMFACAYDYVIKTNPAHLAAILPVFNQTAREVCEGQQYDMNYETQTEVSIADYMVMIRLKTAVFLAGALKIGALIGGASADDAQNLYLFGEKIGMAFQLMDDLLDVFGDVTKFGKKTGGDIVTNKKTFLYLKAFELAKGEQKTTLNQYFGTTQCDAQEKIDAITAVYNQLSIRQITEMLMEDYYQDALLHLERVNQPAERKQYLKQFAAQLMKRDF